MEKEELIQEYITDLYNKILEFPLKVYDIFKDFYGEELVDFQHSDFESFCRRFKQLHLDAYLFQQEIEGGFSYTDTIGKLLTKYTKEEIEEITLQPAVLNRIVVNTHFYLSIYVRFPQVRVTNEDGYFVDITELYAKIDIAQDGRFYYLSFNRSEYTASQYISHYIHSHVQSLDNNCPEAFKVCCLGKGPLVATTISLQENFDETEWQLFCLELSKYVTVESLVGVPYKRLQEIGESNGDIINNNWDSTGLVQRYTTFENVFQNLDINDFIKYFVNKKCLKFNYINSFFIGISPVEYILLISNAFLEWLKINNIPLQTYKELFSTNILSYYVMSKGNLVKDVYSTKIETEMRMQGRVLFKFKNKHVTLNIIKDKEDNRNSLIILSSNLAFFILSNILKTINYKYGNNETSEKVRYL